MAEKGLLSPEDVKSKAEQLIKEEKDLEVIDEAVKLAENSSNPIFAGLMSSETSGDPESRIVNYLLTMNH